MLKDVLIEISGLGSKLGLGVVSVSTEDEASVVTAVPPGAGVAENSGPQSEAAQLQSRQHGESKLPATQQSKQELIWQGGSDVVVRVVVRGGGGAGGRQRHTPPHALIYPSTRTRRRCDGRRSSNTRT